MTEMNDLRKCINHAIDEGCSAHVTNLSFSKGKVVMTTDNNTAMESIEKELIFFGWNEFQPCEDISNHFNFLRTKKFYNYRDRLAVLSIRTYPIVSGEVVVLYIFSTINYEIKKATSEHHGLSLYRWDATPENTREALVKCGWVVTKPSNKISSAYADFKDATFFEKGDMFAVTGLQEIPTIVSGGESYVKTEAAVIINYKNSFDD